jgi:hypothetical protein
LLGDGAKMIDVIDACKWSITTEIEAPMLEKKNNKVLKHAERPAPK